MRSKYVAFTLGFGECLGHSAPVRWFCAHFGLILGVLAGCQDRKGTPMAPSVPVSPAVPVQPWEPTEAQGRLATVKMFVGTVEVVAEQALKDREIQTGMMFRKTMTDAEAMIFVHAAPGPRSYWMKNVTVPLSIGYIDPTGRLLEIHDMQPGDTNGVQSVSANIQYALEVPQGWFQRKGVKPGAMVTTEKGTLPQTYPPNRR